MPPGIVGVANPQVMELVGASVTPATWSGHGKSWNEWCQIVDAGVFPSSEKKLLNVTLRYLVQLWEHGVSAVVMLCRIDGVRFHLLSRVHLLSVRQRLADGVHSAGMPASH